MRFRRIPATRHRWILLALAGLILLQACAFHKPHRKREARRHAPVLLSAPPPLVPNAVPEPVPETDIPLIIARSRDHLVTELPEPPPYRESSAEAADEEEPALETEPVYQDDMSRHSLRTAIDRQLEIFENTDLSQVVPLGPLRVPLRELRDSLLEFRALLEGDLTPQALSREIEHRFRRIDAGRPGSRRQALFTGYYTPVIEARRMRDEVFRFPLYRKPEDYPSLRRVTHHIRPSNRDAAFHLVSSEEEILLTRAQIDRDLVLRDRNLEVAWLSDEMDRYFLHIQGSGFLAFPDGTMEAVQYDGSNRFPYKSVGRQMIDDGLINEGQGSMQGIKEYFRRHPEDIPRYLDQNRRYIFFNLTDGTPRGSGGAELVPGRSIATDKTLYPAGALAYIEAQKPVLNPDLEITGWQPFSRFVVDQDTGSAIQGPGRVDLYFGVGEPAAAAAGHYMQTGKLYYLLKK